MDIVPIVAIVIFLVGSIPPGQIFGWINKKNVAATGSGSTGATNTGRVLGVGWGILTGFIDVSKGYACFLIACYAGLPNNGWLLALSFMGVLGHCFSPWLRFHGGKGVATAFGIMLCFDSYVALGAVVTFAVLIILSKRVSVGSCCAALSLIPLSMLLYSDTPGVLPAMACLTVFILVMHRGNIGRLLSGTEPKLSLKRAT